MKMKMKKKSILLVSVLFTCFMLAGCGLQKPEVGKEPTLTTGISENLNIGNGEKGDISTPTETSVSGQDALHGTGSIFPA